MAEKNTLLALYQQLAQRSQLEEDLQALRTQQASQAEALKELEQKKQSEQADVDRLEGRSLKAFFYNATGKMEEKLAQERREATAARSHYESARWELAQTEGELLRVQGELERLDACQVEFDQALQAKAEALKAAGTPVGLQILRQEEELAGLSNRSKELQEAIDAGQPALDTLEEVLTSLDSAQGWGQWDLLGGGILADVFKYDALDKAQEQVARLQDQLCAFQQELADVAMKIDLSFTMDGGLRLVDHFLDNLFTDWAVLDKISNSLSQVQQTETQLEALLAGLRAQKQEADAKHQALRQAWTDLVLGAQP